MESCKCHFRDNLVLDPSVKQICFYITNIDFSKATFDVESQGSAQQCMERFDGILINFKDLELSTTLGTLQGNGQRRMVAMTVMEMCKSHTLWRSVLHEHNTRYVYCDRECYPQFLKKTHLTQNVHINVGSNITVPDAYTHTHMHAHTYMHASTHTAPTDMGEGQCCLTEIFGEEKYRVCFLKGGRVA